MRRMRGFVGVLSLFALVGVSGHAIGDISIGGFSCRGSTRGTGGDPCTTCSRTVFVQPQYEPSRICVDYVTTCGGPGLVNFWTTCR